ncbi:uncharacterized protein zgc:194930 [Tachysurus fulvidraco]|uniref:uncharacterized protein zgc:194930 n=1 Tax=Tachysurus fulvidraco TaxID=1234273 RepID=UPI000F501BDD|nr:uncharacterized protein zgc:194930 [Tachysurus fulvidraco]XP_026990145.1 uncharacterized protein zgc:194930 [Tachysurus fulvidraco]
MGCRCCCMMKSYIHDPTDPVEVNGLKQDPSTNSLFSSYQFHGESGDGKKQGFHNLGYTSNSNLSKSDIENNHINQSRSNLPQSAGGNSSLYILQPDGVISSTVPSAPPLCPVTPLGTEPGKQTERFRDSGLGNGSDGYLCRTEQEEEGRHGARDTADEESVISVDIHTSSTSLSSADTKLMKAGSKEKDTEDSVSVTDSMVAEALAALEAATAGEEYE